MNLRKRSMSVRLSNADDTQRAYTVAGTVNVNENAAVETIHEASVNALTGEQKASFSIDYDGSLNICFHPAADTPEEHAAIFATIQDYIAGARLYVSAD